MFSYCIGVKFLHGTRLSAAVGRGVAVIEDFGIGVPQVPHPGLLPLLLLRLRLWRFAGNKSKQTPVLFTQGSNSNRFLRKGEN